MLDPHMRSFIQLVSLAFINALNCRNVVFSNCPTYFHRVPAFLSDHADPKGGKNVFVRKHHAGELDLVGIHKFFLSVVSRIPTVAEGVASANATPEGSAGPEVQP